jgi:hypothetical protein
MAEKLRVFTLGWSAVSFGDVAGNGDSGSPQLIREAELL